MTQPSRGPGWYPDPSDPSRNIYWDGNSWQGSPATAEAQKSGLNKATGIAIGVCVLALVGLVMSMQTVSLMSGSAPVWTGVAIAAVGVALAFFLGASKWPRILVVCCLVGSLINAVYIETQLSQQRAEFKKRMSDISDVFNN
jgi:hypothetical protein